MDEIDFDELLADCDSVLGNKFGRVLMIVVFYHFCKDSLQICEP